MKAQVLSISIYLVACGPAVSNDTYPVGVEFPKGGIHIFLQSQRSDRPEICIDSNLDWHIELRCDRGTRRFDRPPEFRMPAGQLGLSSTPKNIHLGDGRFVSAQVDTSIETPFFFAKGDAAPLMLAQPAWSNPSSDWAYHVADDSLWYSVSSDDTRTCDYAAVIFRSADGSQKYACVDGFDELTMHPRLPFAAVTIGGGVRLYRLDPDAGTVTVMGEIAVPDARGRILFDMHRPVLFVKSTDNEWVEVRIGEGDSLSVAPSGVAKSIYTLAAVEESSLEGGDTLVWGNNRGGVAILMKEGRPVARFFEPEATNPTFIQAGHELYVAWPSERDGKKFANLTKVKREPIE